MPRPLAIGIGEILWDVLPTGSHLGGAPANFAYMAQMLGARSVLVSRVGCDRFGDEAKRILSNSGINVGSLQTDRGYPTGTAEVALAPDRSPHFSITSNVAWDYLEWTPALAALAGEANIVCFGTLAQRSPVTRNTIHRFLESTGAKCFRILDVNIRPPFFSDSILRESLRLANVLKLSKEELPEILRCVSLPPLPEFDAARELRKRFSLRAVCITRGACGSVISTPDATAVHSGIKVRVADTVGAGDAFAAALAMHLYSGSRVECISNAANDIGAWVTSQPGAMPVPDMDRLSRWRASLAPAK